MRIALTLLGLDLFTIDLDTTTTECYEEPAQTLNGDQTSYPVSFNGTYDVPDEAGPYHDGWD